MHDVFDFVIYFDRPKHVLFSLVIKQFDTKPCEQVTRESMAAEKEQVFIFENS